MTRALTIAVGLSASLVVCAAAFLLWSRYAYHQWPWSDYPSRLQWCGRDWQPQEAVSPDAIREKNYAFHDAGDLPGILNIGQVWTSREKHAGPFTRCRISDVWVRTGSDTFERMGLLGGP